MRCGGGHKQAESGLSAQIFTMKRRCLGGSRQDVWLPSRISFGLGITFARTLNIPRLEALHGSDIVQLTACGGLFAVGLVGLLGALRLPGD